ncbi:hypothetical protein D6C86_09573 [Aureobasidium pullulans]|uniref:Uncharacterized protein n=1 Tax=Aureobasidium pullulans TaxID=5580 RepID=A0A4S9PTC9_AURPU|nr:hypothetical protein D6C94_05162 [Aureobasidium pullulans]THZ35151.1 hypothetical protein D6C87_09993 [Aureobasidium pullulans]THZ54126.1 hypothetical protein D6C86_09573 [Aureobasidium pullulans]
MYFIIYYVLITFLLSLASAADKAYIVTINLSSGASEWTTLTPNRIPADNAALIDVLQAARNVLEATSADNAYISVVALPWEIRTYKLDEVVINAISGASLLDPRLEEIPRLTMIETRHVVQIAYGFDLPRNLGLPMNFDWSAKVEPLILHIEFFGKLGGVFVSLARCSSISPSER